MQKGASASGAPFLSPERESAQRLSLSAASRVVGGSTEYRVCPTP